MLLFEVFLFALFCFENISSSLILGSLCGFLMLKLVTPAWDFSFALAHWLLPRWGSLILVSDIFFDKLTGFSLDGAVSFWFVIFF